MKAAHADRNGEEQSGATSGRWPTRPIRLAAGIPISARYTMAAICPLAEALHSQNPTSRVFAEDVLFDWVNFRAVQPH
jgi:hypothetical protein